ncbi:HET-domain-containing protein, partial [Tothia fuscella]
MTEDHLQHILDRVDNLDCASCELIGSALPFNTLPLPSRGNNSGRIASNDLPILQPLHGIEIRSGDDDRRLYGTLVSQKSGTTYSTIIAEVMDFGLLATWLEKCKQQHKQGCGQRDLAKRHSMAIEILLIDVDRNCIASKTTASRYFALSYVWGDAITTTTTMQNLAQFEQPGSLKQNLTLPKTVTDAMELTRKMGVQYLWVDCLSIIQDSPKKHQDIINMDIVYSQAELTIVAVSGTDANSGLPGVQRRTRRQRVLSKTQKAPGLYFKLPDSKYKLLDGTKYSKRGWTFQELLLSRRVLFVTEHQATFHCDT